MMAIFFLFWLLIFGGGAVILALIIYAIVHKRPALLAVAGGLVVLGILLPLIFVYASLEATRVTAQSSTPVWADGPLNDATRAVASQGQHFAEYFGGRAAPNAAWSKPALLILIGVAVLLVLRRAIASGPACRHRRSWPGILVIVLIAVFLIGNVRYRASTSSRIAAESMRHTEELTRQASEQAARQQVILSEQRAQIVAQATQRIAQAQEDIHAAMDKFDAPRIPLPPLPPSPPAPIPAPAAATAAIAQNAVASKSAENGRVAANSDAKSTHKEKLKAMELASHTSKPTHAVTQSKPSDGTTAKAAKRIGIQETPAEKQNSSSTATATSATPATPPPAWINNPPKRVGGAQREVITTDEYATADECYQIRDIYLMFKTYQHLQQLVGAPTQNYALPSLVLGQYGGPNHPVATTAWLDAGHPVWDDPPLQSLLQMGISVEYARNAIAKDEYMATTDRSFGPMKKLYTLIEFSPTVDRELEQRWDAYHRQSRLAMVGVCAGTIVGLVALAFALLKIDTWTKGYYTKRLFIGVPAAIIGGLLLFSLIVGFKSI